MDPDHVVHAIIRVNENNFSVCGFETFLTGNKSSDKNLMFLVKKTYMSTIRYSSYVLHLKLPGGCHQTSWQKSMSKYFAKLSKYNVTNLG